MRLNSFERYKLKKLRKELPLEVSADEIAIKGLNGTLFLYKGFNRYYQMYFDKKSDVSNVTKNWIDSLDSWQRLVHENSGKFYFILIPNKASLLRERYPLRLPFSGTPYMSRLRKTTNVRVFIPKESDGIFRQNDTHLSPKGNFALASFILETLEIEFNFGELMFKGSEVIVGDLGSKFEPPISERVDYFETSEHFFKPIVVFDNSSDYLPERHIGISIELLNDNAPIQRNLRIFGNSFLGAPGEYSSLWLLGSVFAKVSFHWSPKVLPEHLKPDDIVIFQSCERFLGYSPDHWQ